MSGPAGAATAPGRSTPGCPPAGRGEPFLPGPTFAAPYHLRGDADPAGYGRFANPTWERLEAAIAELEGGEVVVFASGMAAVTAVLAHGARPGRRPRRAAATPTRASATWPRGTSPPRGVEVRLVTSDDAAFRGALPGARLVWVETPSNPGLAVLDLAGLAAAAHDAGAVVAADTTLATPLRGPRAGRAARTSSSPAGRST